MSNEFDPRALAHRFTVRVTRNKGGTATAVLHKTRCKPLREDTRVDPQEAIAGALKALDERVRPFVKVIVEPGGHGELVATTVAPGGEEVQTTCPAYAPRVTHGPASDAPPSWWGRD